MRALPFAFRKAAAGGGGVTISDNFDRADSTSLGANWSEEYNNTQILSNQLSNVSTSTCLVVHQTPLSTVSQYGKLKLASSAGAWILVFRYVNIASAYNEVGVNALTGNVFWDSNGVNIESTALGFTGGDTFAATIIGTGAATVVRWWKNPTGNAPDAGGTTWGSAAPTGTFTNDPGANAADSGLYVGLEIYGATAGSDAIDDFFAGDVT